MAATELGIGMVGLGGIAQVHLTAYQKFGLDVVAGCDLDERRLEQARTTWHIPQLTTDLAALLANPAVRVVDVNLPHYQGMREPVFEAAGQAGKAIYVQKPLAQTLAEARALVASAERHGVPLMVNQNSLFVPGFQLVKRCLERGTIGQPFYYQIENRGFWREGHPHFGSHERWIMSDMGIHH